MLAKRVIPTMLVRGRTLVKGKQFAGDRSVGHALQAAKINGSRGVDELCILDIAATKEGRGPDLTLIHELSESVFIPISVGGGISTNEDIDQLLRAGADKVVICTAAQENRGFIRRASRHFGNQAICVSIDVREGSVTVRCGGISLGVSPVEWAQKMESEGAGELLFASVDRDGMMIGYDLPLITEVSSAVSIPVIASGGCGSYEHMLQAFKAGADAVASGAMFQFEDATPKEAARFLKSQGREVRI